MFAVFYDGDYVRLPNGEIMEFNYELWMITQISMVRYHPDIVTVILL